MLTAASTEWRLRPARYACRMAETQCRMTMLSVGSTSSSARCSLKGMDVLTSLIVACRRKRGEDSQDLKGDVWSCPSHETAAPAPFWGDVSSTSPSRSLAASYIWMVSTRTPVLSCDIIHRCLGTWNGTFICLDVSQRADYYGQAHKDKLFNVSDILE
nr:hypothetical protein CFP56_10461 [Quercus suber]